MMSTLFKRTALLFFFAISFLISFGNNETDSLLKQLDNAIDKRVSFDQKKENRFSEFKAILVDPNISAEQKYLFQNKLIVEYEPYQFDSVIHYINANLDLSRKLKNPKMLNQTHLHLSHILASSGRYKESIDILEAIDRTQLEEELVVDYFEAFKLIYDELGFYSRTSESTNFYKGLYNQYVDSLTLLLPEGSERQLAILEKQLRDERKLKACLDVNAKRLAMSKVGERSYSIITFQRALAFELEGNIPMQKKFLILSAISDIQASVKDNASLTKLATLLFKDGDINRAYKYINSSFEDADFYNSKLRFVEISNILTVINAAFQIQTEKQNSRLQSYLIVISILSLILGLSLLYIGKQMRNLSKARNELQHFNLQLKQLNSDLQSANDQLINLNDELSETNHVKEQYIGNFLSICSDYIDKLNNYRKLVNKKVSSKKYTELYDFTKSKQFLDDEIEEFYKNFDHTFLHIYPDFVKELNALLLEEEVIELKKGEVLNTELRIFALIRLGITDSSKIAQLLRYSVNTIYNYRVKVKNKSAVEREEFEDLVKKIGSFSK